MKILKRLFLSLLAIVLLSAAWFAWYNLRSHDPKELIAALPSTITSKYDTSDDWWKSTTVYQIYPRSYYDSDGDGIGDLRGIIQKLDYIDSVGFETIWISPFFESPLKDHGYDIANYREIGSEYGDMDMVDSLIAEVHRRDMKIVFDMVLNHTSDQHPWFLESKSSKDNPKSDWYVWSDGKNDGPPNNWTNIVGQESGWNYSEERDQWYYAAFLPFQPDLNMRNPEVKAAIFDMVRFWLDKDVDGFRLDIFNFIFEDEQLRDNPSTARYLPDFDNRKWLFRNHLYNFHQPEVVEFARELREVLESYPKEKFMVGEVLGSHRHMRELQGMESHDGLNLVFLFDILEGFEFSADFFHGKLSDFEAAYPKPLVPTYVFGNHDQHRMISRLDNDPKKHEVLATFQYTVRGVPFTYMGEEIGTRNGDISLAEAQDPLASYWLELPEWMQKSSFIFNRDNCRTPMQWSSGAHAGFTTGPETWLPVEKHYKETNVADAMADPNSLLQHYREVIQLRKEHEALQTGDLELIAKGDLPENVLGYIRRSSDEQLLVLLNFSEQDVTVDTGKFDLHSEPLYARRALKEGNGLVLRGNGIAIYSLP
ncbi:glycoside hydrolase family 13 protein [Robertkochia sediminum]|uniref:glycoside hydrolase family 13 protein n=1 Tax=Robertkochia sediminum TaxID=2785326 RepID=UPI00193355E2|nr:alpha-glucosidase [Robertkochia sediminum]MBL7471208.1 alpha-glucosidase [Robertkochia sediminum]